MPHILRSSDVPSIHAYAFNWLKAELYRFGDYCLCKPTETESSIVGFICPIITSTPDPVNPGRMTVTVDKKAKRAFEICYGLSDASEIMVSPVASTTQLRVYHEYHYDCNPVYTLRAVLAAGDSVEGAKASAWVQPEGDVNGYNMWWRVILQKEANSKETDIQKLLDLLKTP